MTFTQLPTQEEINKLQKASLVSNTERNTSKWSRESLADYCKTSDDQRILNTAMLIPFSLHEYNLDESDYEDYSESSLMKMWIMKNVMILKYLSFI